MSTENSTRVVVTDIRMPFWSMVVFMVKVAIAAIPALIILSILFALLATALGQVFGYYLPNAKMVRYDGASALTRHAPSTSPTV